MIRPNKFREIGLTFFCVSPVKELKKEAETKEVEQNNKDGEYISEATTDC